MNVYRISAVAFVILYCSVSSDASKHCDITFWHMTVMEHLLTQETEMTERQKFILAKVENMINHMMKAGGVQQVSCALLNTYTYNLAPDVSSQLMDLVINDSEKETSRDIPANNDQVLQKAEATSDETKDKKKLRNQSSVRVKNTGFNNEDYNDDIRDDISENKDSDTNNNESNVPYDTVIDSNKKDLTDANNEDNSDRTVRSFASVHNDKDEEDPHYDSNGGDANGSHDQDVTFGRYDREESDANSDRDGVDINSDRDGVDINSDRDGVDINSDRDGVDINSDRDSVDINSDRDGVDINSDRDGVDINSDRDGVTINSDRDGVDINSDRDSVDINSDRDGVDINSDRDGVDINSDRDGVDINSDRDGADINSDRDGVDINSDRDGVDINSDRDSVDTNSVRDSVDTNSDRNGVDINSDRDGVDINSDRDGVDINSDRDSVDTNSNIDSVDTHSDIDSVDTNSDIDMADTNNNSDNMHADNVKNIIDAIDNTNNDHENKGLDTNTKIADRGNDDENEESEEEEDCYYRSADEYVCERNTRAYSRDHQIHDSLDTVDGNRHDNDHEYNQNNMNIADINNHDNQDYSRNQVDETDRNGQLENDREGKSSHGVLDNRDSDTSNDPFIQNVNTKHSDKNSGSDPDNKDIHDIQEDNFNPNQENNNEIHDDETDSSEKHITDVKNKNDNGDEMNDADIRDDTVDYADKDSLIVHTEETERNFKDSNDIHNNRGLHDKNDQVMYAAKLGRSDKNSHTVSDDNTEPGSKDIKEVHDDSTGSEDTNSRDDHDDNTGPESKGNREDSDDNTEPENKDGREVYDDNTEPENKDGREVYNDNTEPENKDGREVYDDNTETKSKDRGEVYDDNTETKSKDRGEVYDDNTETKSKDRGEVYDDNTETKSKDRGEVYDDNTETKSADRGEVHDDNTETKSKDRGEVYDDNTETKSKDRGEVYDDNTETKSKDRGEVYDDNTETKSKDRGEVYDDNTETKSKDRGEVYDDNTETKSKDRGEVYDDNTDSESNNSHTFLDDSMVHEDIISHEVTDDIIDLDVKNSHDLHDAGNEKNIGKTYGDDINNVNINSRDEIEDMDENNSKGDDKQKENDKSDGVVIFYDIDDENDVEDITYQHENDKMDTDHTTQEDSDSISAKENDDEVNGSALITSENKSSLDNNADNDVDRAHNNQECDSSKRGLNYNEEEGVLSDLDRKLSNLAKQTHGDNEINEMTNIDAEISTGDAEMSKSNNGKKLQKYRQDEDTEFVESSGIADKNTKEKMINNREESSLYQKGPDLTDSKEHSKLNMEKIQIMLDERESEQAAKIQSLELMLVKLENKILTQNVNHQSDSNAFVQLENQILKLENELMKLSQNYRKLQDDNDLLKAQQRKSYLELEHIRTSPRKLEYPALSDNSSHEMIVQQQTRIGELSRLIQNQSAAAEMLHSRSGYLEDENRKLFQVVMNQTALISSIMNKLNELGEKDLQTRIQAEEFKAKLENLRQKHAMQQPELHEVTQKHETLQEKAAELYDYATDSSTTEIPPSVSKDLVSIILLTMKDSPTASSPFFKRTKAWLCNGVNSTRLCIFNVLIIANCTPFNDIQWKPCKHIAESLILETNNGNEVSHADPLLYNVSLPREQQFYTDQHNEPQTSDHFEDRESILMSDNAFENKETVFSATLIDENNKENADTFGLNVAEKGINVKLKEKSEAEEEKHSSFLSQSDSKQAAELDKSSQGLVKMSENSLHDYSEIFKNGATVDNRGSHEQNVINEDHEDSDTILHASSGKVNENSPHDLTKEDQSIPTTNPEMELKTASSHSLLSEAILTPPTSNESNVRFPCESEDESPECKEQNQKSKQPSGESVVESTENTVSEKLNSLIDKTSEHRQDVRHSVQDKDGANKADGKIISQREVNERKKAAQEALKTHEALHRKILYNPVYDDRPKGDDFNRTSLFQPFIHACFLSDSMSMLRKIDMDWARMKWIPVSENVKSDKISFIFEPGQAGVKGNERVVDLLTRLPWGNGRAMDIANILNVHLGDCYELYTRGQERSGLSQIFVSGLNVYVSVYCDMIHGGWTVLLKREEGLIDFYRNFEQYKEGFGAPRGEHYIGNEVVHHLTNQGHYSLKAELTDWDDTTRHAYYEHFWLDGEEDDFRLHLLGYSGDAGDGLGKHSGMKFSTYDVDHDLLKTEMGGSCAKRFHGAGWYYKCYSSNLFGRYYSGGEIPDKRFDGVAWKPWLGPGYSLKTVVLAIRPFGVE